MKNKDWDRLSASIRAADDQDWEAAKQWWREATVDERLQMWLFMNQTFEKPEFEIMSRMAILTYTRLHHELDKNPENDDAR